MATQSATPLRAFRVIYYFLLAAMSMATRFAGAQDYTLTKLPDLTEPVAVNSSGQVAGTTTQTGHDLSFFWARTGGLQLLGDLGGGTTQAKAMNDSGAIVGSSSLANGAIHAFLWTPGGGMQDLGSPQGGTSVAIAVNSAGEVAGYSLSKVSGTDAHAFFWSSTTGTVDLGVTDGNSESFPSAINDRGEIVGYEFGTGSSAFRWTMATGMQTLVDFFVPFQPLPIVNDNDQIAGISSAGHAALRSPDGAVQDLGTLSPDASSVGLFINSAGHIVGTSRPTPCCGHERTFFWTTAGMFDIGFLPNHQNSRSIPVGFNNRDQIVGRDGATYLWSPTIGLRQIPAITFKFSPQLSNALNDAGQILGTDNSIAHAVLASPTMHVTISSSQNPSQAGQSVTFTADVSAIVGLPPDGEEVVFKDGKKVLGTGTLSNGTVSFTTSSLTVRTHYITANYAGDNNYLPNKSARLTQVVNP